MLRICIYLYTNPPLSFSRVLGSLFLILNLAWDRMMYLVVFSFYLFVLINEFGSKHSVYLNTICLHSPFVHFFLLDYLKGIDEGAHWYMDKGKGFDFWFLIFYRVENRTVHASEVRINEQIWLQNSLPAKFILFIFDLICLVFIFVIYMSFLMFSPPNTIPSGSCARSPKYNWNDHWSLFTTLSPLSPTTPPNCALFLVIFISLSQQKVNVPRIFVLVCLIAEMRPEEKMAQSPHCLRLRLSHTFSMGGTWLSSLYSVMSGKRKSCNRTSK